MIGHINRVIKTRIKMFLRYFLILTICISFLSCKSQKNNRVEEDGSSDLILLAQDGYSGIEDFETLVVKDQKTLTAFYSKINRTRKPGLPVPKIDFANEMVIIVCIGEQLGEDLPDLIKKKENDQKIFLSINPHDSKKEDHTTLVSSPFCVYKMPLSSKEVEFIKD